MCIADLPPAAMPSSSISSEVAWAATMPWRAAALMAMTFCMTGSRYSPPRRFLLGGLLVSTRFRMSALKAENGFVRERIVSSRPQHETIVSEQNTCDFNQIAAVRASSGLVAGGREQIAA